jgi:hypothetical protein
VPAGTAVFRYVNLNNIRRSGFLAFNIFIINLTFNKLPYNYHPRDLFYSRWCVDSETGEPKHSQGYLQKSWVTAVSSTYFIGPARKLSTISLRPDSP